MQKIRTHFNWFTSFRHLRLSASLIVVIFLFALVNASLFLLAKQPDNATALSTPTSKTGSNQTAKKVVAPTPVAEPTPAPQAAAPTPAPAPAPAPQPAPTPKPAPVYDKVTIGSIGLSSRYVTVGLTSTNAIDVNPTLVGWWNGSSQPGSPGAAFLDGHNPGALSKLSRATEGMQITITKASGEVLNYTIVHTETVMLEGINMRAALSVYGGASEGLNLMTCAGTYNPNTGTTDQRLVVYAVRS